MKIFIETTTTKWYVLKGQYIPAQGNAMGLRMKEKIVCDIALKKFQRSFQTKWIKYNFVRKKFFVLINTFVRTIFDVFTLPGAICPGLNYFGPSVRKNIRLRMS